MDGVEEAKVDFDKRRLEVVFDPEVVAPKRIVEAAKGLGFTLVESGSAEKNDETPERE